MRSTPGPSTSCPGSTPTVPSWRSRRCRSSSGPPRARGPGPSSATGSSAATSTTTGAACRCAWRTRTARGSRTRRSRSCSWPREPDEDGPGPYYRLLRGGPGRRATTASHPVGPTEGRHRLQPQLPLPVAPVPGGRGLRVGRTATTRRASPRCAPSSRASSTGPTSASTSPTTRTPACILRPYSDRPDDALPSVDKWTYDELGPARTETHRLPGTSGCTTTSGTTRRTSSPASATTGPTTTWACSPGPPSSGTRSRLPASRTRTRSSGTGTTASTTS